MKRKVRCTMKLSSILVRLWDYCQEYCTAIRNLTATDHHILDNSTPYDKIYGHTPNTSNTNSMIGSGTMTQEKPPRVSWLVAWSSKTLWERIHITYFDQDR